MTDRAKIEAAIAAITKVAPASPAFTTLVVQKDDLHAMQLVYAHPNTVGLSAGLRQRAGRTVNDNLVLRVYVVKKWPASAISTVVPNKIKLADGTEIATDVVEVGKIEAHTGPQNTSRMRPLVPGISIGHFQITAGTLGCIVRCGVSGKRGILSNFHILGNDGAAYQGEAILQPGPLDGGTIDVDSVATLAHAVPFLFDGSGCKVDAAIAELTDGIEYTNDWLRNGNDIPVLSSTRLVVEGERVFKIGRTSGFSSGRVTDASAAAIKIDHKRLGSSIREPVTFTDQVICTKYADPGDSGSIVFGEDGKIIGLHMAGSDKVSVFNKIGNVLDALNVEIERCAAEVAV